jgi:hypothetical protein
VIIVRPAVMAMAARPIKRGDLEKFAKRAFEDRSFANFVCRRAGRLSMKLLLMKKYTVVNGQFAKTVSRISY